MTDLYSLAGKTALEEGQVGLDVFVSDVAAKSPASCR